MMKIVDKYLLISIIRTSFATLFSLVLLFSFFKFLEELNQVGEAYYTLSTALQYIFLLTPFFLNSLVTLSVMIGTVFVIGRLNHNKELQILYTGAISRHDLIYKSIKYPFLISVILIIILELIFPLTSKLAENIKNQALGKPSVSNFENIWLKKNNQFIYFQSEGEKKKLINIFEVKENNLTNLTLGRDAIFFNNSLKTKDTSDIKISKIDNLFSFKVDPYSPSIEIPLEKDQINILKRNPVLMSISELISVIVFSINNDTNSNELILELISRVIKPFTLIGMIVLSLPFILSLERNVTLSNKVFLAISIGTLTHLFTKVISVISVKYESMLYIGPIMPTIILMLLGMGLIRAKLVH